MNLLKHDEILINFFYSTIVQNKVADHELNIA